jgi:bifunctional ADP-heptose synthase (sugar kinase/adenylyltransferase)
LKKKHKKKATTISEYFNSIYKGHLEYFNNANAIAGALFVILNSDLQRGLKGFKEFKKKERLLIVQNVKAVDKGYYFC